MPIVVNSNVSATEASFNLSRANDSLRKSLTRLSSGKRINSPADDAGGLAVAYKLDSKIVKMRFLSYKCKTAPSEQWVKFWTAWLNCVPWPRTSPKTPGT